MFATAKTAKVTKVNSLTSIQINGQTNINIYGVSESLYEELNQFKSQYTKEGNLLSVNDERGSKIIPKIENEVDKNEALKQLKIIILNKEVFLEEVQHNTYLVYLTEDKRVSINEFLLTNGYVVTSANLHGSVIDLNLISAQNDANNKKVGLWAVNYSSESISKSGDLHIEGLYWLIIFIIVVNSIIIISKLYVMKRKPSGIYLYYVFVSLMFLISTIGIMKFIDFYLMILFLIMLSIFAVYIAVYLLKFILKYKNDVSNIVLIQLIVGICIVVIYYFSNIYMCFDNPSNIHINKYNFITNELILDDVVQTNTYLSRGTNNNLSYVLDYIYFSGTTFFGGSYGDVTPKGYLRVIVLFEMIISFMLQLIFFSVIFNLIYEKLTATNTKKFSLELDGKLEHQGCFNEHNDELKIVDENELNNSRESQIKRVEEGNVKKSVFVLLVVGITLFITRFFRK
ncbi:ion channel [Bacillus cereus group sp. BfR-BA-01448]|uniref:ion channel n=3 Tax=unclassified Bacillus cereus group TaxID=2750818 RepID=UPI001F58DD01|nr:ion channel [Bacillus cereus group sp. BfR-BA-01448]